MRERPSLLPPGVRLSDRISFDAESAIATVQLAAWEPALDLALRSVFAVASGIARLDYSHLSAKPTEEEGRQYDLRSARERLVDGLMKADALGQLELFIEILQKQQDVWAASRSLSNGAELNKYREYGASKFIFDNLRDLRETALREGTLASRWIHLGLGQQERSTFLLDREMFEVLLTRVQNERDFRHALSLLQPRYGDDAWAFAKLAHDHWPRTQGFIADHFAHQQYYRSDNASELVRSLFRHSAAVQGSRWACEQLLQHAHPLILAALLPHSHQLTADDVRGLLGRYRDGDDSERKALEPGVRSAILAFGGLAKAPLPSDIVLVGLWLKFEFADVAPPTPAQHKVNVSLCELPTGSWRSETLWEQLGPDARAAWRADLNQQVGSNSELAHGLIDFACRWLDQTAFVEIEPVLRNLVNDNADFAFLRALADGGPRLVALRAQGLARAKLETVSGDRVTSDESDGALPEVGARTWLGDPAAERVIHRVMAGAEASFCRAYRNQWGADEEMLTADLLSDTRAAAREATEQLRRLAGTTKGRYPTLAVNVRQPGKTEEGRKTAAGAPLAADILFLTRIQDGARVLIERATFVQVKKRRGGTGERFGSTVAIDLEQCSDLLTQSEHAFYLFLTPPSPHPQLWVTPARLVGNLTQLHDSRSTVSALQARDASCSYADFFLKHLVGLWSGDERASTVAIAKGDPTLGRTPRHVVEILMQRRGD